MFDGENYYKINYLPLLFMNKCFKFKIGYF